MVYVWMNDAVNDRASCLSLSMSARRHMCIFLRVGFARCACADEWILYIVHGGRRGRVLCGIVR